MSKQIENEPINVKQEQLNDVSGGSADSYTALYDEYLRLKDSGASDKAVREARTKYLQAQEDYINSPWKKIGL